MERERAERKGEPAARKKRAEEGLGMGFKQPQIRISR